MVRLVIAPGVFYFLFFCIFTYPLILHFSSDCLCNPGDGYQNVWNLWWVGHAITVLHQSPWYTTALYPPVGLQLIVHALDPFNGLIGILLTPFFTLQQRY